MENLAFSKGCVIFSLNYHPLWSNVPFKSSENEICNHDISKTITGRSFKLGQLIEDDELITWLEYKKCCCF